MKMLKGCLLPAAMVALCMTLPSCISYDVTDPTDYVGPLNKPATGNIPPPQPPPPQPTEKKAAASQPTSQATGPIKISVTDAILLALENNESLLVQRYNPQISRTGVMTQLAVFDPDLTANVSGFRDKTAESNVSSLSHGGSAEVDLNEFLPSGTTIDISATTDLAKDDPDLWTSRMGLTVTQSLARGFGFEVNLASLRQAKLSVLSSQYELRGFAESLVSDTEQAYWDYLLAWRQIEIVEQSLKLAEDQLRDTNERIKVGKLSEVERAAAEAQVASRKSNLIDARSLFQTNRLQLLRFMNPSGANLFDREIEPKERPTLPKIELGPVTEHVKVAMRMRPDLNQARLLVNTNELQIVKTRNGLLPQMDLFVTLGRTGYAKSFGPSLNDITNGRSYDVMVGMNMEYPPFNRAAQASNISAILTRDQSLQALDNTAQLAEVDVRSAYIEVSRTNQQVEATAITRKYQEESLRAETEKFRVGKSTSLLVAQASNNLLVAQIAEVQAQANYLKALVSLYQLEGSLLERRGIASPGREMVVVTKKPRP